MATWEKARAQVGQWFHRNPTSINNFKTLLFLHSPFSLPTFTSVLCLSLSPPLCPVTAGKLPRSCHRRFSLAPTTSPTSLTWNKVVLIKVEKTKPPPPTTKRKRRIPSQPLLRPTPPKSCRHHRESLPEQLGVVYDQMGCENPWICVYASLCF